MSTPLDELIEDLRTVKVLLAPDAPVVVEAASRLALMKAAGDEMADNLEALCVDVENCFGDPHTLRHARCSLTQWQNLSKDGGS